MRRVVGGLGALAALALPGLVIACDGDALDTVRVCGDLVVPDDLVALRVTVSSVVEGALVERTGGAVVLDDPDDLSDDARQLPIAVAVGAVTGLRNVRVQALDADGAEVARGDVLVDGPADGALIVNLGHACLGFTCPLGQTCEDGSCTVTPAAGTRACVGGPSTPEVGTP